MLYRVGADLVLSFHFLFVLFAVFGGFLALFSPTWAWVHVPAVLWSSTVNLMGWTCPLTPAENGLRARAGGKKYAGGFIEHYIGRLVYPGGMPRRLELVAGVSIVAWSLLVYAVVFFASR